MPKSKLPKTSFGYLSREEMQKLVDAPYGGAAERIQNPYDLLHRCICEMILKDYVQQLRDPIADPEFLEATVHEMIYDILQVTEDCGFLRC